MSLGGDAGMETGWCREERYELIQIRLSKNDLIIMNLIKSL